MKSAFLVLLAPIVALGLTAAPALAQFDDFRDDKDPALAPYDRPDETIEPEDYGEPWPEAPQVRPPTVRAPLPAPPTPRAAAPRAGGLLRMFHTFCRNTHAGQTAILAAAERQGFARGDPSEVKTLEGFAFQGLEMRVSIVDGVRMFVAAGRGRQSRIEGGPGLDVCIVGVSPSERGAAGTFGEWAGVDPVSSSGGSVSMFMFSEGAQGRRPIGGDPAALRRHVRDGDVQLLMVGDQDGSTLAIYGVMRQDL